MSHSYTPPWSRPGRPQAAVTPRQYDLRRILGVWAAAALPMAVLVLARGPGAGGAAGRVRQRGRGRCWSA